MVEYKDGAVIAQMGHPDMREAIQFAFAYPERLPLECRKMNFAQLGQLSFFEPDRDKFPALSIAYDALAAGGNMPCVMNAANEAAVKAFLQEKIGFYDITDLVRECMDRTPFIANPDIDTIYTANDQAYKMAESIISKF